MMTAVSLSSAAADSDPINTPGKQAAPHPPSPPASPASSPISPISLAPLESSGEMEPCVLSVHHGWKVNLTEHGPLDKQSI